MTVSVHEHKSAERLRQRQRKLFGTLVNIVKSLTAKRMAGLHGLLSTMTTGWWWWWCGHNNNTWIVLGGNKRRKKVHTAAAAAAAAPADTVLGIELLVLTFVRRACECVRFTASTLTGTTTATYPRDVDILFSFRFPFRLDDRHVSTRTKHHKDHYTSSTRFSFISLHIRQTWMCHSHIEAEKK